MRFKKSFIFYFSILTISVSLVLFSCKSNSADQQRPEDEFIKTANEQQLNERAKELSEAIKDEPNADLYFRRAKIYDALKQLELAKNDIEDALRMDSTRVDYYIYAGNIYEKLPYTKGALLAYEEAVRKQPDNKELLLKLGEMFYYVRNREKSFQYLNAAIKIDKYLAKAYYYRGLNFKEIGEIDKALRSFQTAAEVDPGYFDAYLQLGLLYAERKDPKALAYYNNALNVNPQSARAYYARGMYLQEIDSNKRAINDYEKMLDIEPGDKNAHYNLGYNYYLLKDYNKAVEHFTEAIKAENKYQEAYYGRYLAYKALGKTKEAAEDLKKSKELDPLYDVDGVKKKPKQ